MLLSKYFKRPINLLTAELFFSAAFKHKWQVTASSVSDLLSWPPDEIVFLFPAGLIVRFYATQTFYIPFSRTLNPKTLNLRLCAYCPIQSVQLVWVYTSTSFLTLHGKVTFQRESEKVASWTNLAERSSSQSVWNSLEQHNEWKNIHRLSHYLAYSHDFDKTCFTIKGPQGKQSSEGPSFELPLFISQEFNCVR